MEIDQTLYGAVNSAAKRYPRLNALYYKGRNITYSATLREIDALAAGLSRAGIKRGDVVTVCMPNVPESIYALYAVNKLGAVSMLVYIIHRNNLFVKYLQGEYFDYAITRFGANALIPAILILAVIFFVGSTLIALAYKATAERYIVDPLSAVIERGVDRVILALRAATLRKHVYHRLPRALAPDSD